MRMRTELRENGAETSHPSEHLGGSLLNVLDSLSAGVACGRRGFHGHSEKDENDEEEKTSENPW